MSETVFLQVWMLLCGTIVFLGSLRFLRRFLELRQQRRGPIAIEAIEARLERIESAVETTAIEVERMSEANRFIAKLLAERGEAAALANPPERVITPH